MKQRRTWLALLLCVAMVFSMVACGKAPAETEEPETPAGAMTAGKYTATVNGMNNVIEVEVEVSEDAIVAVNVLDHQETPGIGGELYNLDGEVESNGMVVPVIAIPERIVAMQSLAVDNVTGATITSAAIKSAVADCLTQAGTDPESWKAEVATEQVVEDMDADVVVVGGGGAGLAAAIAAAEQGKSVVVIEKNGSIGGDTLVCGAIYNAPDQALQSKVEMTEPVKQTLEAALAEEAVSEEHQALIDEVQAQWDAYKAEGRTDLFDSPEWYALQTWINGDKVANIELAKVLCYNSFPGLEWIQSLGMKFADQINQGAGSLWQRTHTSVLPMGTGFFATYGAQLGKLADKITVLNECTAKELVVDGDRVVGVKVEGNHSKEMATITANNGVILAAGGFAANSAMVQEYNTSGKWADLSAVATTNRFSCSQGDGIVMAKDAGASLTDMDQIQLLYLGNMKDGQLTKMPKRTVNGTDQLIFVNKDGERFVREDGRRDQICLAVLEQPEAMFYFLESGDGEGYVDINSPDWKSADGFTFDYLKENGYILVGETLEDLAGQIGCDPATLQATVDTFNASVASGEDEFGRTLYSTKLENGPWVATARQACVHHTMGGVTIDTEARVLNEAGEPIVGLYAAGEITGGIHGGNRLGGNAVVDTVVFGKLAADTLVKDAQ